MAIIERENNNEKKKNSAGKGKTAENFTSFRSLLFRRRVCEREKKKKKKSKSTARGCHDTQKNKIKIKKIVTLRHRVLYSENPILYFSDVNGITENSPSPEEQKTFRNSVDIKFSEIPGEQLI